MPADMSFISRELERLKSEGLYNNIRTIDSPQGAWLRISGKKVLNLCSNNYLGLCNHPRVLESARNALAQWGIGPGAVRSIAGTMGLHKELETRLAKFKGAEATIVLQSGFCANLAAIPSLVNENDLIFSDELNHASIIDGCRLSRAKIIRYDHCSPASLDDRLKENAEHPGKKLVITDGVFSMDGDIAPLTELVDVAERHNVMIMVDDAHGEGVLGDYGKGIVDHFHLHGRVTVEVGTLSKAFGVVGGFVAGSAELVEFLSQKARPFLFSSAMTAPDVAANLAAVDMLEKDNELVSRLWENAGYFQKNVKGLGFNIGKTQTPITPIIAGDSHLAKNLSASLFEEGVFAQAIAFPTVPRGTARIRAMISAAHSRDDLDFALKALEKVGKNLGII